MNDSTRPSEQPDPIFDRLRGADPAAGAEPDRASLEAAVRARRADPGDELATARARRGRATWWPVAAVAASALLFGTAGYAVGTGDGGTAVPAAGVITLSQSGTTGTAAPESAMGSADSKLSSSMLAPWYGGRTVFTAVGLSDEAGSAQAWTFDPAQVFTAATADRLAQALGLAGTAVLTDGAWTVGPVDGSGPSLQLQPDGLASVNFYDPGLDPYACGSDRLQGVEPGSTGDGAADSSTGTPEPATEPAPGLEPEAMPLPEPPQTCITTIGPAPQGDAAVAKARDLIGAFGLDASAFEYETSESGMTELAYVAAYQVLDGQRTGSVWNVSFVGDGVQSLYGSIAPLVSLGTYDVVSATDAVARLADPRFGASYGGPIMYAAEQRIAAGDAASAPDQAESSIAPEVAPAPERTVPPTADPGSAIAWPVTEVALTSSRLGLTMYTQPDGSTVLLPAYELTSDDGQVWSVMAVTEAQLDFAPVG
ncbi:hypothetical protein [Pengzhenrongella frigida]|uniref:hypothetical protein n=1 Tax=Pengzhenrongella frigida TaxID=1259133 RepID=UPI0013ECF7CD|nr:hypothetical protein [Cellulomonas sp. HLT2-17]